MGLVKRAHTGADGVVNALELVARREVLALSRDAAEVVRVVLEARAQHQFTCSEQGTNSTTYQRRVWLVYGKRAVAMREQRAK